MKRSQVAFILSIATIFGGHIHAGRWAKALLFAALVVVTTALGLLLSWCAAIAVLLPPGSVVPELINQIGHLNVFFLILALPVVVVWITSALVAARDARIAEDAGPEGTRESPAVQTFAAFAMCGLGLCVMMAIPVLWYATVWIPRQMNSLPLLAPSLLPMPTIETVLPQPKTGYLGSVMHYRGQFDSGSPKTLASSSGTIVGMVRANGEPVAGLRLQLWFAPDLRTQWAVSGSDGRYSISVPVGKYALAGWEIDRPSAEAVVPGKIDFSQRQSSGRAEILTVSADGPTTGPDFDFVDAVVPIRPTNGMHVRADVVFEWKPIPGASRYDVTIFDYGYGSRTLGKNLKPPTSVRGTTATAALLGVRLERGHYYSWDIETYDSKGRWVSRSPVDLILFKVK